MLSLTRLFWLVFGYSISLLIFQQGFLLKRKVFSLKSQCSDVVTYKHCWIKPQYKRSILLIIDGLRYDFIEPISKEDTPLSPNEEYFRGQMPSVANLLETSPNQTRLFRFIADAPTTTFQRIKALTTGTIPAFIEVGDNFGGANVFDDNFVEQFIQNGRNVTLLGDDTWLELFPDRYHRHFTMPSFDIKDLHLVDDLVIEKIYEEIKRDDWSLLIAHGLGVDHCGHRYGSAHPEMRGKLRQMDNLIRNLTHWMAHDTILLVMGDHGMTTNGEHGGDSQQEVESALFAYTKKNFEGFDDEKYPQRIQQIDLVPTLSLLMDTPIPFSNLGLVVTALLPENRRANALKLNAIQIMRYAQQYNVFEPSIENELWKIIREYENLDGEKDAKTNRDTIQNIQRLLRSNLNKFDLNLAFIGLLCFVETFLYNIYILILQQNEGTFAQWVFRSALAFLQMSLFFGPAKNSDIFIFLIFTLSASIFYFLFAFFVWIVSTRLQNLWPCSVGNLAKISLAIFHSSTYFSNSFIIYESSVIRFLTQFLLLWIFVDYLLAYRFTRKIGIRNFFANKSNCLAFFSILFCMISIRIGKFFEICREEQIECENSFVYKAIFTIQDSKLGNVLLTRIALATISIISMNIFLSKNWLSNIKPPTNDGFSLTYSMTRLLTIPLVFIIIIHWICESGSTQHENFAYGSLKSAQLAYFLFATHFLATFFFTKNFELMFRTQRQILFNIVLMILGDNLAPNFVLHLITTILAMEFHKKDDLISLAFIAATFSQNAFYSLAHQATFTSIPWTAAFVGLPGNFWLKPLAGLLILLHIYAGNIVSIFNIIYLNIVHGNFRQQSNNALFSFLLFSAIRVFVCCLAGIIHRKHLMLFKVFAPKFVFEAISLLFCCFLAILLALIVFVKTKINY